MTQIDLSLPISNGMPAHAFFPSPIILPYVSHEQAKSAGLGTVDDLFTYSINYISTLEHVGTHVDAPLHIGVDGASIDQVPLDWFAGKAVCLDLRHILDLGDIDVADLEQAEAQSGVTIDGHIVLLCTGFHDRHWPEPEVVTTNPGITAAATHWLADRSRVHGVEGPSTDKAGTKDFPNHRVCRDRGMIHYEWLVNLDQLIGRGEFQFVGYPLKWVGGTGSPVRAVAELRS
jgi:kynurenine formamidase